MKQELKKQITESVNNWIDPSNPERSGSKLAQLADVNISYISSIKAGNDKVANSPIKDEYYYKIAQAIGLQIDMYDFHWDTSSYKALSAVCQKMQKQARICSVDSKESGASKTYTLKRYATHNEKVAYMKCTHTMTVKDFLEEIIKTLRINTEAKSPRQKMETIKQHLSKNKGWLFIIDETDDIKTGLWKAIKEIYDILEKLCGLVICGMGTHNKITKWADKDRDGFKQIKRRLFSYKVMLPGLSKTDIDFILKELGITDKKVIDWFKENVSDYQMLSEYLRDALAAVNNDPSKITVELLNELFG
jgi:DNA transposition AAA+ family ATPase